MQHSFEDVQQLAYALPEDQRIQLANSLYESLASVEPKQSEAELTAAWDVEIKRRLDEIDSGAVQMIPGEEVLARMDARLKARLQQAAPQK